MNIAVLECEYISDSPVSAAGGYTELFAKLLSLHTEGRSMQLTTFEAHQGQLPAGVEDWDAYLITGSYAGVYEGLPWINELSEFTRRAYEAGVPLIGICFGHQLLAHALGGTVEKATVGWGLGVMETAISRHYSWMGPEEELNTAALIYMHQDQVTSLPESATAFASTKICPYAGFTLGPKAVALQGHPEFTPQLTERLIHELWDRFPEQQAKAALASLSQATEAQATDHARVAGWIARFLQSAAQGV